MKKIVCWGGTTGHDSFRHIWAAYHLTARKLGIDAVWVPDATHSRQVITPGSVVLTVDVWNQHIGEAVPGADYVVHNYGPHPLLETVAPENLVRLQVWTTDAAGEEWGPFRQYDREARTLFQVWGSDLLAEEFLEPTFNPQSRDVSFVGAIWSDTQSGVEQGNEGVIADLKEACKDNGLTFRHHTQVSTEQMIRLTREARLAPVVVGGWQSRVGYMPCRAFKTAAYGVPVFTNSPYVSELFWGGDSGDEVPVGEIVEGALRMRKDDYLDAARADQRVAANFTYRESIASIDRALQEGR